ncbi:cyclin-dependent kinase regulatory subunit CKS1 [Entomortierella parvispora]|uniref:Cyclin-dependent kinases regulatory subunit n=1 Tax=Entomortierella parvispora TaxID=205924 RepID=A0A9P3LZZ6_9FUNG|nr:cyclin-dependent kinase regulatory subunit CKS1 [Entomortierella parvispora]
MTRAVQRDHPMLDDPDENMPPHHQMQQVQAITSLQRQRSRQAQRPFFDKAAGGLVQAQQHSSHSLQQQLLEDENDTESPIMPDFEELPIQRQGRASQQQSRNSQQYQQQLQQRQYQQQQQHDQLQSHSRHGHSGHPVAYEHEYMQEEEQDHPGDMSAVEIHIDPASLDQDTEMASRFEQSRAKFEDPRYQLQQQYRSDLDKIRASRHRPPTPAPVTRPRGASINNGTHMASAAAPEGMVAAAPDARMELLQREKYIHQKQQLQQQQASQRPSARTELLERSRQPSQQQILGERDGSTGTAHPQLMRQSSAPNMVRGVQSDAAAAMRKRSREEEYQHQQRQQDAYRAAKAAKNAAGEDGSVVRQRAATMTSASAAQVQPQPLTQQHLELHERLQSQEYRRRQLLHQQQQQQQQQGIQVKQEQFSRDQHQPHHQPQQHRQHNHQVKQEPQLQQVAQVDPAKRKRARTNPEHQQHHHQVKKKEEEIVFPANIYVKLVEDPEAGAEWRGLSDRQKLHRQFKIWSDRIEYGNVYSDKVYDYRNVTLPKAMLYHISSSLRSHPDSRIDFSLRPLSEEEWRGLGVQMSRGWDNWTYHAPEPHVLMFRRTVELSRQVHAEVKARQEKDDEEAAKAKAASRGVRVKKEEPGDKSTVASRPSVAAAASGGGQAVAMDVVKIKKEEENDSTTLQLQSQPAHPQH